jgi:glutamate 5-kinase
LIIKYFIAGLVKLPTPLPMSLAPRASPSRRSVEGAARMRVVVKFGTSVLTAGTDRLDKPRLAELVRQVAAARKLGAEVIVVTSGAVLSGWACLGYPKRKRTISEKQLLAAVGQGQLIHLYSQLADLYGIAVAQMLLTRDDFRDRRRYVNARSTFWSCLEKGVLPIVNENDVVAVDEIRVGDNDTLSARVAALAEADLLVICTDCAGLFTADPRVDETATLVPEVGEITPEVWALAGGEGSHRGTGGMRTKIHAADIATRSGIPVVIAAGDAPDVILRAVRGDDVGTRFLAQAPPGQARKRWILAETVLRSKIAVDDGATEALTTKGRSLLPAGVVEVSGDFVRGDTVRIFSSSSGRELARGLSQYGAADLAQIKGKGSEAIAATLGFTYGDAVVHRDDLVVFTTGVAA